jgi:hypothetical protein
MGRLQDSVTGKRFGSLSGVNRFFLESFFFKIWQNMRFAIAFSLELKVKVYGDSTFVLGAVSAFMFISSCVADRHRYLVFLNYLSDFLDALAFVSSVVKNSDGTIRNAVYLEVQLVDASLKEGEVIILLCRRRILLNYLCFIIRFQSLYWVPLQTMCVAIQLGVPLN